MGSYEKKYFFLKKQHKDLLLTLISEESDKLGLQTCLKKLRMNREGTGFSSVKNLSQVVVAIYLLPSANSIPSSPEH